MKSRNTPEKKPVRQKNKSPYTSPKVFYYGSVEKLTASKTGNARDSKNKKT